MGFNSGFRGLKYLITWDMRSVHNAEFLHLYHRYVSSVVIIPKSRWPSGSRHMGKNGVGEEANE